MICVNCGRQFEGNFCPSCGEPVPTPTVCKGCGASFEGNFCPNCGLEDAPSLEEICKELYDRNGNHIDVEKLAGVYLSVKELVGYFQRNTTYTTEEYCLLSEYIYNNIEGENYGFFAQCGQRSKFEMAGGGAPICKAFGANQGFEYPSDRCKPEREQPAAHDSAAREQYKRKSKADLKRQARNNGQACCPKCGSTSLSANKKGFGIGKAVVGAWAAGPFGLVAGNLNAKKVWVTCLNCGKRWKM